MSTLTQFSGGGIKSIQTGYLANAMAVLGATTEELYYLDVTVSAITNTTKCVIQFDGAANNGAVGYSSYYSPSWIMYIPTTRIVNSTTLRIMVRNTGAANPYLTGRWTITEYN
jgi:hypothetical protein